MYSNPLPHVLILTAIVVGVATLAARDFNDARAEASAMKSAVVTVPPGRPPPLPHSRTRSRNRITSTSSAETAALATQPTARAPAPARTS